MHLDLFCYGSVAMERCGVVEVCQRASSQEFSHLCAFHQIVSCVLPCKALDEASLEKQPLLGSPTPKVGYGDLIGSGASITRVSMTFNFLSYSLLSFFWYLQSNGGLISLVPFFTTILLLSFLCVGTISCYP